MVNCRYCGYISKDDKCTHCGAPSKEETISEFNVIDKADLVEDIGMLFVLVIFLSCLVYAVFSV